MDPGGKELAPSSLVSPCKFNEGLEFSHPRTCKSPNTQKEATGRRPVREEPRRGTPSQLNFSRFALEAHSDTHRKPTSAWNFNLQTWAVGS